MADNAIDTLQDALTLTVDAEAGYETMVSRAEPEFRHVAVRFREAHNKHADQLAAIITAHGGEPDRDGGVFSMVNRAVVSLRSAFDEIDANVMKQVADGEEHIIEALGKAGDSLPEGRDLAEVRAMQAELRELLNDAPGQH
ncbi:protein of unknown function [Roseivivax halotolerans]|uniref:DUF2383 domain-containing protein n=1 Tax=Roseivivax halotolerans TaxID=93684 RepID=A0A1I5V1Q7_9RHOB|nr:DUF2383 domain-containing protein [Roseivivax halotolerans]SFQ01411.1 protein of unknown function [Roseivivax halotolerans]